MKTMILGRQTRVTDDQKALITKKLDKFDKFFGDGAEATVTLRKTKIKEVVEVTISYRGTLYRSEVEEDTYQTALDRCVEHIERQIRKNKTRLARRLREDAFVPAQNEEPAAEEEEGSFIIRLKEFPIKPISVDEAILQMNLLGHDFYVFENADSGKVNVVYRRHEEEYGLIVPEKE